MKFWKITDGVFHSHVAMPTRADAESEFFGMFGENWFADEEWECIEIPPEYSLPISISDGPLIEKSASQWFEEMGPGVL